jgi:O-antigen ligase
VTKLQAFYERTAKLEEFVILAYAVAVFLPITYSWIVLITGIVVFVLRAILQVVLIKQGVALSAPVLVGESSETYCSQSTCYSIKDAPFTIPLLVFAIAVFITGFSSGGISEAFASFKALQAFLIYFIAYHAFRTSANLLPRALLVLLSVGAVAGVWGAIQQIFHYHPFDKYPYLQATGFVGHPMAYAGQMETTACLGLGLLLTGGWEYVVKNRALFIVIAASNLAGVFYASERSAWLGMLFAILAMSSLISIRTLAKVVVGLALVGVISWFAVPVVQARLVPMLTNIKSDVGVQARFVIWQKSFEIWKEHPVVGVGPRKFPKIDIPEAIVPGESTHLVHAHNNFLHMMATMGTLGLLAFVYLEFSTLLVAFRAWTSTNFDKFHRAIGLSVLGGIVSLMVAGLFEYNFGTGHVRLMHWFVLAMLMSAKLPIAARSQQSNH